MDSKFYVSLEAARLLKEKGYNLPCVAYYQNDEFHPYSLTRSGLSIYNKNAVPDYMNQYSAPTKAEAIDWLEGKGMLVWAEPTCEDIWMWFIMSPLHFEDNIETNDIIYPTRLEAEEAAIIKALELL